jgi:uncharacterized membrane protein
MNLDLYAIGWVHLLLSLIALAAGAIVLVRPKGTPVHRLRGRIYVIALVLTCATSFAIYRQNMFWFPHWTGIVTLAVVAIGFAAVHFKLPRRGWMHLHLTCMVASYYLLIAGGVNEVLVRVDALRRLIPNFFNSPLVGMTHFAVMVVFALLIAYFNAALLLRPRPAQ